MYDICLIILSAFAVYGLFSLWQLISQAMIASCLPKSYTFLLYSESDMTYQKYKTLSYNIYNNEIVFIGEDDKNIYTDCTKISPSEVSEFVINNLFTNNKQ